MAQNASQGHWGGGVEPCPSWIRRFDVIEAKQMGYYSYNCAARQKRFELIIVRTRLLKMYVCCMSYSQIGVSVFQEFSPRSECSTSILHIMINDR